MSQKPEIQLAIFAQAVDAVGGQRAMARFMGISEKEVRDWLSGDAELDRNALRSASQGLIKHADMCRRLERKLSPAFVENLTDKQLEGLSLPDGRPEVRKPG
ncbi:YdaS family helix-turn-helix protein [Novosphingobium sp. PhB165]|uniref:YdaS family helix-turn-helix protein n=1 Tax=Novosphingobium sp. PhB165 TaxID=2485105 RepID=UPI00104F3726|nr:YdaS family helix-turn-helix protein [Novosphingobium sp. PhB165]